MAKITTLSFDWSRSLNEQKGWLFDCIEREGGLKRHSPIYLECRAKCWSIIHRISFPKILKNILSCKWSLIGLKDWNLWEDYELRNFNCLLIDVSCFNLKCVFFALGEKGAGWINWTRFQIKLSQGINKTWKFWLKIFVKFKCDE